MFREEAILRIIELLESPPEIYYSINIEGNSYELDNSSIDINEAIRYYFSYGTDSLFFGKFMPEVEFTEEELERLNNDEHDDLKNCLITQTVRFDAKDGGVYIIDSPLDEYGTTEEEADSEEAEEIQEIVNDLLNTSISGSLPEDIVLAIKRKMLDMLPTLDPNDIINLLEETTVAKRNEIAKDPGIHPKVLKSLLLDKELLVANNALRNPVIEQLSPEERRYVNIFITLKKKDGKELRNFLNEISFKEIEPMLDKLLKHKPFLFEDLYTVFEEEIITEDIKKWIRWGIPNLSESIAYIIKDPILLSLLSNNTITKVRQRVAENEYTPVEDLIKLVHDKNEDVADSAADNPRTPPDAQNLRYQRLKTDKGISVDDRLESERITFKDNVSKNIKSKSNTDLELIQRLRSYLSTGKKEAKVASSTIYYHGTPSEEKGKSILKSGVLKPGVSESPKSQMAPIQGRVYLSKDPSYALMYALGGDMAGGTFPESILKRDGNIGYLFAIKETEGTLIPDEDSVGELIYKHKRKKIEAPKWLIDLANFKLTDNQWYKIIDGEYAYWAQGGKKLLKLMTPQQKEELLQYTDHVSHEGELKIVGAWKIDKRKSKQFKRDGSNLFEIAEKVSVKKKASSLPDHEDLRDALEHMGEYVCSDHEFYDPEDFTYEFYPKYPVRDIPGDFSSWVEVRREDFKGLSLKEAQEELESFRGEEWAERAIGWIEEDNIPPIIIAETPDYEDVADGRGRVNLAIALGLKTLPAWVIKTNKKAPEEDYD